FQQQYELVVNEQHTVSFIEYYPPPLDYWFEVNAYPTPDGLAVYFRDVNERLRQEDALRLSEERFRLISMATNDVIWDWDVVKRELWWNDSMFSVFGHDPEILGSAPDFWVAHIHPADREVVHNSILTALNTPGTNSWQQ